MPRDDDRRGRDRDDDRRGRDRDRGEDRGRDRDDRGGRERTTRDDRDDDRRGSRDRDSGSGSSKGYTYRERSADDARERATKGARDYDKLLKPGIKVWSPGDENRIRILPPGWEGAKHYGIDVMVHYGVGPDRESYICLREHKDGDPCPICEERDEARRDDRPDEDYVKELEAKRRVLVFLVDRNNEKEGVQAWLMPWTVDKDITKVSIDKESGEVLPIDHPEDGYDVSFDKTGKGRTTKYEGVSVARRSSSLGKSSWLDYALDHPLPEQLQFYDYEHIAKTFGAKGQQRDSRGSSDRDDDRRGDRDDRRRDDRDGNDDRRRDRDDRGGKDRDERGSSRDRDEAPRRGGRERGEPELSWTSIHDMTRTELEDLIEQKDLPIKPSQAKDDEDLADWVCEEMKIDKDEAPKRRAVTDDRGRDDKDDRGRDDKDDRLSRMRERRERD